MTRRRERRTFRPFLGIRSHTSQYKIARRTWYFWFWLLVGAGTHLKFPLFYDLFWVSCYFGVLLNSIALIEERDLPVSDWTLDWVGGFRSSFEWEATYRLLYLYVAFWSCVWSRRILRLGHWLSPHLKCLLRLDRSLLFPPKLQSHFNVLVPWSTATHRFLYVHCLDDTCKKSLSMRGSGSYGSVFTLSFLTLCKCAPNQPLISRYLSPSRAESKKVRKGKLAVIFFALMPLLTKLKKNSPLFCSTLTILSEGIFEGVGTSNVRVAMIRVAMICFNLLSNETIKHYGHFL